MTKVYVGCSLTQASEEFRTMVTSFKEHLGRLPNVQVLEFLGLHAGTSTDVYRHDLSNVESCDVLIGIVDEPSIGLGMEIQHGTHCKKPTLCLFQQEHRVTRMLHGAHEIGHISLVSYANLEDMICISAGFISRHSQIAA